MKYLLGLLLIASMTACGSSGGAADLPEVTFTTELISRAESGVITAFTNGDRMSVYCTETNSISGTTPSIHAATYADGVWRPSPSITVEEEQRVYLFAIYPYDAAATDATAYPVTVASQIDYLYSGTGVGASTQTLTPVLRMRHAMAMLAFNVRSYTGGTLQSVTIESADFPLEGTLRVTGMITPTKYGNYTKNFNTTLSEKGFTADHPGLFVMPYQMFDGLKVKMTISGETHELILPSANLTSGKKYVASVVHTAQGLSLADSEWEVIALDEPLPDQGTESYSLLKVGVSGQSALAPVLTDTTEPYGFIYWGDGTKESYSATAGHGYNTAGNYVVTVDAWNAEEVTLNKLTNVTELDLSKF